jgi:ferredoxin
MALMAVWTVTVRGFKSFPVREGEKLALAIERAGYDISHRCGGHARCTTCRVRFHSEEPPMNDLERRRLEADGTIGCFRLSCQVRVDRNMEVEVLLPVHAADWDDPGLDLEP